MDKKEYTNFLPKNFTSLDTIEKFNDDKCKWNSIPNELDEVKRYDIKDEEQRIVNINQCRNDLNETICHYPDGKDMCNPGYYKKTFETINCDKQIKTNQEICVPYMGECKNGTLLPQELRTQHNHCDNCNHEDVDHYWTNETSNIYNSNFFTKVNGRCIPKATPLHENLFNYARYNPHWTTYTDDATLPTNLTKSTTNVYRHSDSTVFPNSVHSKRMRKKEHTINYHENISKSFRPVTYVFEEYESPEMKSVSTTSDKHYDDDQYYRRIIGNKSTDLNTQQTSKIKKLESGTFSTLEDREMLIENYHYHSKIAINKISTFKPINTDSNSFTFYINISNDKFKKNDLDEIEDKFKEELKNKLGIDNDLSMEYYDFIESFQQDNMTYSCMKIRKDNNKYYVKFDLNKEGKCDYEGKSIKDDINNLETLNPINKANEILNKQNIYNIEGDRIGYIEQIEGDGGKLEITLNKNDTDVVINEETNIFIQDTDTEIIQTKLQIKFTVKGIYDVNKIKYEINDSDKLKKHIKDLSNQPELNIKDIEIKRYFRLKPHHKERALYKDEDTNLSHNLKWKDEGSWDYPNGKENKITILLHPGVFIAKKPDLFKEELESYNKLLGNETILIKCNSLYNNLHKWTIVSEKGDPCVFDYNLGEGLTAGTYNKIIFKPIDDEEKNKLHNLGYFHDKLYDINKVFTDGDNNITFNLGYQSYTSSNVLNIVSTVDSISDIPFNVQFFPKTFDVHRLDRNGNIRCPIDYKYFQAYSPILVCSKEGDVVSSANKFECKESFNDIKLRSDDSNNSCGDFTQYKNFICSDGSNKSNIIEITGLFDFCVNVRDWPSQEVCQNIISRFIRSPYKTSLLPETTDKSTLTFPIKFNNDYKKGYTEWIQLFHQTENNNTVYNYIKNNCPINSYIYLKNSNLLGKISEIKQGTKFTEIKFNDGINFNIDKHSELFIEDYDIIKSVFVVKEIVNKQELIIDGNVDIRNQVNIGTYLYTLTNKYVGRIKDIVDRKITLEDVQDSEWENKIKNNVIYYRVRLGMNNQTVDAVEEINTLQCLSNNYEIGCNFPESKIENCDTNCKEGFQNNLKSLQPRRYNEKLNIIEHGMPGCNSTPYFELGRETFTYYDINIFIQEFHNSRYLLKHPSCPALFARYQPVDIHRVAKNGKFNDNDSDTLYGYLVKRNDSSGLTKVGVQDPRCFYKTSIDQFPLDVNRSVVMTDFEIESRRANRTIGADTLALSNTTGEDINVTVNNNYYFSVLTPIFKNGKIVPSYPVSSIVVESSQQPNIIGDELENEEGKLIGTVEYINQTKRNTYSITFNKTISTNLRPYDKIFKRNRKSNVVFKQINFSDDIMTHRNDLLDITKQPNYSQNDEWPLWSRQGKPANKNNISAKKLCENNYLRDGNMSPLANRTNYNEDTGEERCISGIAGDSSCVKGVDSTESTNIDKEYKILKKTILPMVDEEKNIFCTGEGIQKNYKYYPLKKRFDLLDDKDPLDTTDKVVSFYTFRLKQNWKIDDSDGNMWPNNRNVISLFDIKLSPLIKELNLSRCGNKSYDFCKKGGKYCMSIDQYGKTDIYYNDLVGKWVKKAPAKRIDYLQENSKLSVTIEELKSNNNPYIKIYNTIQQAENELFIPEGTIDRYIKNNKNGNCIIKINKNEYNCLTGFHADRLVYINEKKIRPNNKFTKGILFSDFKGTMRSLYEKFESNKDNNNFVSIYYEISTNGSSEYKNIYQIKYTSLSNFYKTKDIQSLTDNSTLIKLTEFPDRFSYDKNEQFNPSIQKGSKKSDNFNKQLSWPDDIDNKPEVLNRTKTLRYKFNLSKNEVLKQDHKNNSSVNNQILKKKYICNYKENGISKSLPKFYPIGDDTEIREKGFDNYDECYNKCFNTKKIDDNYTINLNTRGICSTFIEEEEFAGDYHDPVIEMTKNIECEADVLERIDSKNFEKNYNTCWYKEDFRDTNTKKFICKGTGYMNSTAKNNIIWETWDAPGCSHPENPTNSNCNGLSTPNSITEGYQGKKAKHHRSGECQMNLGCRIPSNMAGEKKAGIDWNGDNPAGHHFALWDNAPHNDINIAEFASESGMDKNDAIKKIIPWNISSVNQTRENSVYDTYEDCVQECYTDFEWEYKKKEEKPHLHWLRDYGNYDSIGCCTYNGWHAYNKGPFIIPGGIGAFIPPTSVWNILKDVITWTFSGCGEIGGGLLQGALNLKHNEWKWLKDSSDSDSKCYPYNYFYLGGAKGVPRLPYAYYSHPLGSSVPHPVDNIAPGVPISGLIDLVTGGGFGSGNLNKTGHFKKNGLLPFCYTGTCKKVHDYGKNSTNYKSNTGKYYGDHSGATQRERPMCQFIKKIYNTQTIYDDELKIDNSLKSCSGNTLVGNLSSDIGRLIQLTYLNLSHNKLNGEIPSEIGNCKQLKYLYLNDNEFEKNIPDSFVNLTKLISLKLQRNNLSCFPTGKSLNKIQQDYFKETYNFDDSNSSNFGVLLCHNKPNLKYLDLRYQKNSKWSAQSILSTLPLTRFSNLDVRIQCSNNRITILNRCYDASAKEFSYNTGSIVGAQDYAFSTQNKLDKNKLLSLKARLQIDTNYFQAQYNLSKDSIISRIESLPRRSILDYDIFSELRQLNSLEKINIDNFSYIGEIPDLSDTIQSETKTMSPLSFLKELIVSNNSITKVHPNLNKLYSLTKLNFSNCKLNSFVNISALEKLQFLDLSHNNLSGDFNNILDLNTINILTTTRDASINKNIPTNTLKYLNLKSNNFTGKFSFQNFQRLEYINLNNNNFIGDLNFNDECKNSLKEIHIAHNNFSNKMSTEDKLQEFLIYYSNRLNTHNDNGYGIVKINLFRIDISFNKFYGNLKDMIHFEDNENEYLPGIGLKKLKSIDNLLYLCNEINFSNQKGTNKFNGIIPFGYNIGYSDGKDTCPISNPYTAGLKIMNLNLGNNEFSGMIPKNLEAINYIRKTIINAETQYELNSLKCKLGPGQTLTLDDHPYKDKYGTNKIVGIDCAKDDNLFASAEAIDNSLELLNSDLDTLDLELKQNFDFEEFGKFNLDGNNIDYSEIPIYLKGFINDSLQYLTSTTITTRTILKLNPISIGGINYYVSENNNKKIETKDKTKSLKLVDNDIVNLINDKLYSIDDTFPTSDDTFVIYNWWLNISEQIDVCKDNILINIDPKCANLGKFDKLHMDNNCDKDINDYCNKMKEIGKCCIPEINSICKRTCSDCNDIDNSTINTKINYYIKEWLNFPFNKEFKKLSFPNIDKINLFTFYNYHTLTFEIMNNMYKASNLNLRLINNNITNGNYNSDIANISGNDGLNTVEEWFDISSKYNLLIKINSTSIGLRYPDNNTDLNNIRGRDNTLYEKEEDKRNKLIKHNLKNYFQKFSDNSKPTSIPTSIPTLEDFKKTLMNFVNPLINKSGYIKLEGTVLGNTFTKDNNEKTDTESINMNSIIVVTNKDEGNYYYKVDSIDSIDSIDKNIITLKPTFTTSDEFGEITKTTKTTIKLIKDYKYEIPSILDNDLGLKQINFVAKQNSKLITGNISDFNTQKSLTKIKLENTLIKGNINSLTTNNLKELSVINSSITINGNLKNLENLVILNLSDNGLTAFNVNLPKLKILNLSDNEIKNFTINDQLLNLEKLDLSSNKINNESILSSINNLTKLQELDLSNNLIEAELPDIDLPKLKILDISNNKLSQIGKILNKSYADKLPCIEEIILENQYTREGENLDISVTIPEADIFTYNNLKILNLMNCKLRGPIPNFTEGKYQLKILNLSNNEFIGEIPKSIEHLDDLEILNLSNNELMGVIPEEITTLDKLEELSLNDNQLHGNIPNLRIKTLHSCNLSYNELSGEIPDNFGLIFFDIFTGKKQYKIGEYSYTRTGTQTYTDELCNVNGIQTDVNKVVFYNLNLSNNYLTGKIPYYLEHLKDNIINQTDIKLIVRPNIDYPDLPSFSYSIYEDYMKKGLPKEFSRRNLLSIGERKQIINLKEPSDEECDINSYKVIESYDIVRNLERGGALVVQKNEYCINTLELFGLTDFEIEDNNNFEDFIDKINKYIKEDNTKINLIIDSMYTYLGTTNLENNPEVEENCGLEDKKVNIVNHLNSEEFEFVIEGLDNYNIVCIEIKYDNDLLNINRIQEESNDYLYIFQKPGYLTMLRNPFKLKKNSNIKYLEKKDGYLFKFTASTNLGLASEVKKSDILDTYFSDIKIFRDKSENAIILKDCFKQEDIGEEEEDLICEDKDKFKIEDKYSIESKQDLAVDYITTGECPENNDMYNFNFTTDGCDDINNLIKNQSLKITNKHMCLNKDEFRVILERCIQNLKLEEVNTFKKEAEVNDNINIVVNEEVDVNDNIVVNEVFEGSGKQQIKFNLVKNDTTIQTNLSIKINFIATNLTKCYDVKIEDGIVKFKNCNSKDTFVDYVELEPNNYKIKIEGYKFDKIKIVDGLANFYETDMDIVVNSFNTKDKKEKLREAMKLENEIELYTKCKDIPTTQNTNINYNEFLQNNEKIPEPPLSNICPSDKNYEQLIRDKQIELDKLTEELKSKFDIDYNKLKNNLSDYFVSENTSPTTQNTNILLKDLIKNHFKEDHKKQLGDFLDGVGEVKSININLYEAIKEGSEIRKYFEEEKPEEISEEEYTKLICREIKDATNFCKETCGICIPEEDDKKYSSIFAYEGRVVLPMTIGPDSSNKAYIYNGEENSPKIKFLKIVSHNAKFVKGKDEEETVENYSDESGIVEYNIKTTNTKSEGNKKVVKLRLSLKSETVSSIKIKVIDDVGKKIEEKTINTVCSQIFKESEDIFFNLDKNKEYKIQVRIGEEDSSRTCPTKKPIVFKPKPKPKPKPGEHKKTSYLIYIIAVAIIVLIILYFVFRKK